MQKTVLTRPGWGEKCFICCVLVTVFPNPDGFTPVQFGGGDGAGRGAPVVEAGGLHHPAQVSAPDFAASCQSKAERLLSCSGRSVPASFAPSKPSFGEHAYEEKVPFRGFVLFCFREKRKWSPCRTGWGLPHPSRTSAANPSSTQLRVWWPISIYIATELCCVACHGLSAGL